METDKKTIIRLETLFKTYYNNSLIEDKIGSIHKSLGTDVNLCCLELERQNIIRYAYIISNIPEYNINNLSIMDIFFVLIYILYMLSYVEQSANWLFGDVFRMYIEAAKAESKGDLTKLTELYLKLTTGHLMVESPTGDMIDLSHDVRITFLGMTGAKKRTTYKNMRRKFRKFRKSRKSRNLRKFKKLRKSRKY